MGDIRLQKLAKILVNYSVDVQPGQWVGILGDVAAVPDDAGAWQRATGPLQFIPSTWDRWASDGDGDGVDDPQDIDDAAYAAARYLCASGADLATGAGWSEAVFSYNHSSAYVRSVYDAAQAYADRTSG